MAINGTHSIFRLTNNTLTTETQVSDKVEFDGDAAVPDGKSKIISIRPIMQMIDNDNPVPGSEDAPGSQDVGNAPAYIEIKGYFDETGGQALGPTTFRNWMRNAKKVKTHYPYGRFGFRSNDRDEFDAVCDSTGGYQLVHFEMEDVVDVSQPKFMARLKFVGDFTLLGA